MEAARMMGELAPVGILSLAAVLEAKGLQPEVVDLNRIYYSWLQGQDCRSTDFASFAAEYLAARDFDLFGFSTVCSSYPLTLRIAEAVKQAHPESVIVLGGPQASVVDVATMRAFPAIDLILRGEAEQSLPELVDALTQQSPLTAVPASPSGRINRFCATPTHRWLWTWMHCRFLHFISFLMSVFAGIFRWSWGEAVRFPAPSARPMISSAAASG